MAYDLGIAECVRDLLRVREGFSERKMFGGICFMLHGNMCCGVVGRDLCLRLGEEGAAVALAEPHTRPMDFTGKPLKSMIYVSPDGFRDEADLAAWVNRAVQFAHTLPWK